MLSKITSTPKKVVNHVRRNRGKYSAIATTAVLYKCHQRYANEVDAFLEEKGLYDEFWYPESE